jgi:hypothetical protein
MRHVPMPWPMRAGAGSCSVWDGLTTRAHWVILRVGNIVKATCGAPVWLFLLRFKFKDEKVSSRHFAWRYVSDHGVSLMTSTSSFDHARATLII